MVHSLTDGVRGLPPPGNEDPKEYTSYGIDWEAINDPRLRAYRRENGAGDEGMDIQWDRPEWINTVTCEPPSPPLVDGQLEELMMELAAAVDIESNDMGVRRLVWTKALELLCRRTQ